MARYTMKDKNGRYYIESANGKLESNIKGHTYGEAIDRFAEYENADVVPRSEVEELQKQLDDYKKFVGEIRVTGENHAVIIVGENVEYIDKRVAEGFKNMAVNRAKQEVMKDICNMLTDDFRGFVDTDYLERIIKLYEKKYIGG